MQTSDAGSLIFTHDFTNRLSNPLRNRHPMDSLMVGASRPYPYPSQHQQTATTNIVVAIMSRINLINPIVLIMG